jgi:hypothetical protein
MEEIMSKDVLLLSLIVWMLPLGAHATTKQDLKEAYQPATVVSVTKLNTTANYAYDVAFQVDCTVYVGRYKSANDYAAPVALAPNRSVSVSVEKHWLHVSLPSENDLTMRIVSETRKSDVACAKARTASSTEEIPAGTILPVSLPSDISSDKSPIGSTITATLMQDVPLKAGITLPKGSKVIGRVLETVPPGGGSDEVSVSFQFDQVRFGNRTVPITTNLRALASEMEVSATRTPKSSGDESSAWELVQIGGDQVSYGQGPVITDSHVVGTYTSQGTLAYLSPDLGTECRATIDGNTRPQAFWVFSVHACGVYGLGNVKILHSGRTEPVGQVTLISDGHPVKVGRSSGMLLRVDPSTAKATSAQVPIPSEVHAQ